MGWTWLWIHLDKGLVMDEGRRIEEGEPMQLIDEVSSRLRELCMIGKHQSISASE